MLVPPIIVSRPGENMTPTAGCLLTGSAHPADGPYLVTTAGTFSTPAVKELAACAGLLVHDRAEETFEKLLLELVEAKETANSRGYETRQANNALEETKAELEKTQKELNATLEKLAKTQTAAAVVKKAVADILKEPAGV